MARQRLFENNLSTTLASAAGASDVSLVLTSATGWPSPASPAAHYATLDDGAGNIEIVEVTARSGTTLTVTRAQQGTTARTWAAGTTIELRWTAGDWGVIDAYIGPTLTLDGQIAIDTNYASIWYRSGGTTYRAARAPGAGTAAAKGVAVFGSSNGAELEGQTAWTIDSGRLAPTSTAVEFVVPTLPVVTPTPATDGRVWVDPTTSELVLDVDGALVRLGRPCAVRIYESTTTWTKPDGLLGLWVRAITGGTGGADRKSVV